MNLETRLSASLVLGLAIASSGCSGKGDAVTAAQHEGWENVRVTSSSYFLDWTCADGEKAYEIEGKNARGKTSTATVCCGYTNMKGCTIRYD